MKDSTGHYGTGGWFQNFGGYKVTSFILVSEFALKAEKATENVKVLKMEVYVLMELKKSKAKHFCDIIDRGYYHGYNFLVMTLVGSSLDVSYLEIYV